MDSIHDRPLPIEVRPDDALPPIKLYRCEMGHEVLTRTPFEVTLSQDSEQGRMVYKSDPLCILCFGSKLNKVSRMVEIDQGREVR